MYQYHHCHVTQPLLHEQLLEWGIDISSGQINAILQNDKAAFHQEKDSLLEAGLKLSSYISVDDTGAQHKGNNGYVTHIGNTCYGLCWVHAARLIHKMLPLNDQHREDIALVRGQIWTLYADLKSYKAKPTGEHKALLSARFDEIFTQKARYTLLNKLLRRLHNNRSELLLVLERPEIPLHTNGSERDLRDQVKYRKISGGTRSDLGQQCRDTFSSLKKTCQKLNISFWRYLVDRISCSDQIPPLAHLVEQRIASL